MRVLHVAPTYYPAVYWGGPIFSTRAICDGVCQFRGVQLQVLTTDAAGPSLSQRLSLATPVVTFESGYRVHYARRIFMTSVSLELITKLGDLVRWCDVIHLTGTYSFTTVPVLLAARWFDKPVVWSPRGALQATEEWHDAPRKNIKWIFEQVCRVVLPKRVVFHVTAEVERQASSRRIPGIPSVMIPNSVAVPETIQDRVWRPDGRVRLLFLSRIQEKKGLDTLIEALNVLPERYTLTVCGTGEESYISTMQKNVAQKGLNSRVRFLGNVKGVDKAAAFAEADLFVLPTRSENFGIAIAEALAHGVPVVTTTAAPWAGLVPRGCGLWIEQGVKPLAEAIVSLEKADLQAMGALGREWMGTEFKPEATAKKMYELYGMMKAGYPAGAVGDFE